MLLQSHADRIQLLPALPQQWGDGGVTGLRARGGLTVDMHWADGQFVEARVHAARAGIFRFRTGTGQQIVTLTGRGGTLRPRVDNADHAEYALAGAGDYRMRFATISGDRAPI